MTREQKQERDEKPCPRCAGFVPMKYVIDDVWYCDEHVGEILREIAANGHHRESRR